MEFFETKINDITFMASPNIQVRHAFTTRFGGVSSGIYESLNLAQRADDNLDNVKENYERICEALGICTDDIVYSTQVHGTHIRVVSRDDCGKLFEPNTHQADGLITQTPGVALMVFVADCVPVLLYDPVKKVAGAVHAGWRSTAADITGIAVQKMISRFECSPESIKAAIGPCISDCCFETDSDVPEALLKSLKNNAKRCISKNGNKYFIDLKEANRLMLENAGLKDIIVSDECTSCRSDIYWSHRKTQGRRGSQAAFIVIKD